MSLYALHSDFEFDLTISLQNAIGSIHPVIHKMLDAKTIDQYLEKNEMLPVFLNHLHENNKKMFLITNSPFHFV